MGAGPTLSRSVRFRASPRRAGEEDTMVWQLVLGAFLVLLPFTLLFDLHPDRERLDARGRPLRREWR